MTETRDNGTVVEAEIPIDEFALGETLSALDGVRCEVERVVAHDDGQVMPFVWMSSADADRARIETLLSDDPSVSETELLIDLSDRWLYRMQWVGQIETLVGILTKESAILAVTGSEEGWSLRTLFPDRQTLSRTYERFKENGLTLEIRNIYRLEDGQQGRLELTDEQQEALILAYERGYYDIPRETTAAALADELGITHQALSERLRRGHENLVGTALVNESGVGELVRK
ncbi:helix-turn-helix domain-containing protein [Haladaptatus salinisoli]|uniref:helix-turn-helix domain-containing protein n=1 Tax=Haladaptatus salinisoli TaxID=2884876 RepID=UPI001D0BD528|nr:helix-turn-helix domain-containing protein [Haladaptatus salinisoli]